MSKKMVYLDTNTFYEFLAIYGFQFSSVNVGDNTTIDYARLKTELDNLIKNKQIALTSTLLFEVIAHHRNNLAELRKILLFLQFLSKEKSFPLIINHNGPCFTHLANKNSEVLQLLNPSITKREVKVVVSEKIDSESNLLSIMVYFLSLAYVLSRYGEKPEYQQMMNIFADSMKNDGAENIKLVKKILKSTIKDYLVEKYKLGEEEKSFRKIFNDVLGQGIALLLIQLDLIRNTVNSCEEKFFYDDTFGDEDETIENICNRWNKNEKNFKKNLKIFIDCTKTNILTANYSQTQAEYLGLVIYDLFNQKTKMDKNDAADFWVLNLATNNTFVMTFDKQMIEAIRVGNNANYNFIESLDK